MIGYILGTAVVVWVAYKAIEHHYAGPAQLPEGCATKTTCPINIGTPSPANLPPVSGVASALTYRWCVPVKPGDTAGNIAKGVTGDARRYLELLAANPTLKRRTDPATGEVNLDWSDVKCPGQAIQFPFSWNPWIDQKGVPRGAVTPYPPFDVMPAYPAPTTIPDGTPGEGRMPNLTKAVWS